MAQQVTDGEKYLGGFLSPSIRNRRMDMRPCGVYATNKRIFLVRSPLWIQLTLLATWLVAFVLVLSSMIMSIMLLISSSSLGNGIVTPFFWIGLALLFVFIGSAWYKNFSEVPIADLERKKIWDIQRDQISSIEMTRNTFSNSGGFEIHLKSGDKRSIFFAEKGSFDRAKLLLFK